MSVLHNPARGCASIYPKRSDATRRTAAGFPRRANLLKIDARTCRSVTYTDRKVTGHYPLTQPLEAAHLGRHQAAACWPAIAPQQALVSWTPSALAEYKASPGRSGRATPEDGCIVNGEVRDFDGTDLYRLGINAKMNLAPLVPVVGAAYRGLPLTFSQHLHAGAVDQQLLAGILWPCGNDHAQCFLTPTKCCSRALPNQAWRAAEDFQQDPSSGETPARTCAGTSDRNGSPRR